MADGSNYYDVDMDFVPGSLVRNADKPDWGIGQIQSVIEDRITVNFEHKGKVVMILSQSNLELALEDDI